MSLEEIKQIIEKIELKNKKVPKGKILLIGNKKIFDKMQSENWRGKFYYSNILNENECYIVEDGFNFKI